ncbi:MAG: NAD(P)-dependent alcohol dehydrogenase [Anaerolineae bacterium]|nr:NAD(P)-dependent alcohol dehydrogenase [Anaerolineae bacterium]
MKAVVWTKYGPPEGLEFRDVEKPTPKDNQVLVRIHASTVTAGDAGTRSLDFPAWLSVPMRLYMGILNPRNKILGQELAGEIVEVGKDVTRFKVGDAIFAAAGITFGGYAEYVCLAEDAVMAQKPTNMTYEEAAAVPTAGLEALHFLSRANVQPGEKVLVVGAGGSIGTFGVQLAKYYGAEVTGIDSTGKLDMVRSIGAEHVIDFTQEDFTQRDETYDIIFDVIGKSPYEGSLNKLNPYGRYLLANPTFSQMFRGRWTSSRSDKKVILGPAEQTTEALVQLRGLIEAGEIRTIIDKRFPLEQTAEAHRYVETGQKKGNVIISVIPAEGG